MTMRHREQSTCREWIALAGACPMLTHRGVQRDQDRDHLNATTRQVKQEIFQVVMEALVVEVGPRLQTAEAGKRLREAGAREASPALAGALIATGLVMGVAALGHGFKMLAAEGTIQSFARAKLQGRGGRLFNAAQQLQQKAR